MLPVKRADLSDTLTIELTNCCTLACTCCPNGRDRERCRPKHTLDKEQFLPLLSQIDIPFGHVFLHLHGEPFLNKDLPVMVELLQKRGVKNFTIFSNAYRIDLDLLKQVLSKVENDHLELCFSAELYSRAAYEKIRHPGNFDTVWESLGAIDKVMTEIQMNYTLISIIDSSSIDELKQSVPDIFRRLKQLRDIHFSNAFPWPHLPQTGDIAGHLTQRRHVCSEIWQLPVIFASGEVSMCSSDYRGECIVGSLWEHKYSELMNNRQARRFRRNIAIHHAERNPLCSDCLIDRHIPFSRTAKRKFIENAKEDVLEKYFNGFHKYFDIDGATHQEKQTKNVEEYA